MELRTEQRILNPVKFLLLNQTFHPDVVSTAQHLTDLALRLAERGPPCLARRAVSL